MRVCILVVLTTWWRTLHIIMCVVYLYNFFLVFLCVFIFQVLFLYILYCTPLFPLAWYFAVYFVKFYVKFCTLLFMLYFAFASSSSAASSPPPQCDLHSAWSWPRRSMLPALERRKKYRQHSRDGRRNNHAERLEKTKTQWRIREQTIRMDSVTNLKRDTSRRTSQ